MAQWQSKLDLTDVWNSVDDGTNTIHSLASIIAKRLREIDPHAGEYILFRRDDIADTFEAISEDNNCDVNDFDWAMTDLYDWGDISLDDKFGGKKVCWIATTF